MSKLTTIALGAGLMYLLDPDRGRARRTRLVDQARRISSHERAFVGRAARDVQNRARGLSHAIKRPFTPDAPDAVIEARVHAQLGRAVSHPGAIMVEARDGRIELHGPVLASEADAVLRCARRVSGVRHVIDRLDRRADASDIPALQGPGRIAKHRRPSPASQLAIGAAGAAVSLYGLFVQRGLAGALLAAAGAAVAIRSTAMQSAGVPQTDRSVSVHKSIYVAAPVHTVFDLWTRFDNFPRFMQHVRDVDLQVGGPRSRWIVDGPAGTALAFEAETIDHVPDHRIAWRTIDHQPIEHHGEVRFEEVGTGTRVHVQLTYRPPGGVLGHAIAHILGWDPKSRLDDDLVRMKALLEEGKTRAHRSRVALSDLH